MQFLVTVSIGQHAGAPLTEFQAAMTRFVDDETRAGTFVLTGGLAAHADGAGIRVSKAGLVRGEPHLPIHGYAVVECPALKDAVDIASRLLRLHQDFVPEWKSGTAEIRAILGNSDLPSLGRLVDEGGTAGVNGKVAPGSAAGLLPTFAAISAVPHWGWTDPGTGC